MAAKRNLVSQTNSLGDRLAADASKLREQASHLAPGAERDALLSKAHRNEMAVDINTCLSSPRPKPQH
jgi:hypothetical protein